MAWEARWRNEAGVEHRLERTADGLLLDHASQDVAPILDLNKQMRNHGGDGYLTGAREMRRVASIPASVRLKWMLEEGWDWMDATHDPDVARKFRAKMNDPEWQHLRTAPGRI